MAYFKSTFALDLIAFLPQVLSGLDPFFGITKMLRLYYYELLHYPIEVLINLYHREKEEKYIYTIVYAFKTVCRILLLMHYLAVIWIYVGSEHFLDFEEGRLPW